MDLQEVGGGCEDWMELAEDRDRWRALVSTMMNLRVDIQNDNIYCGFYRTVICSDRRQYSVSLWSLGVTALIIKGLSEYRVAGERRKGASNRLRTPMVTITIFHYQKIQVLWFVTPCRWARSSRRFKYHSTSETSGTARPTTRRHTPEDEAWVTSPWGCQISPRLFYHSPKHIHTSGLFFSFCSVINP